MTVQLIDRESDGIRICRVEGESLVTVIIPRSKLSEAKRLPGLVAMTMGYVRSHGGHETDNAAVPEAEINPYKEQRVQGLHNDMLFRMRVLGYDLDRTYEGPKAGAAVFHTRRNGVAARGRYDKETGHFTVLWPARRSPWTSPSSRTGAPWRPATGFSGAPRTAPRSRTTWRSLPPAPPRFFVLGGSQNGWVEWVGDDGGTLSDIYCKEEN